MVYLPRYSPHLNPVETVWRRVKGWPLLWRSYGSVAELREAVEGALRELQARLERGGAKPMRGHLEAVVKVLYP